MTLFCPTYGGRALALYSLIALLLSCHLTQAQDLHYQHFTVDDGLPSQQVYNIYQDVNGYLWFATDKGICRYDGSVFESFISEDLLPEICCFRFYPQANGDIWVSTLTNEYFIFNPSDYEFRAYRYNEVSLEYAEGGVNDDLLVAEDGTIYVSFVNKDGVLQIDSEGRVKQSPEKRTKADSTSIVTEVLSNGEVFTYRDLPPARPSGQKNISERREVLVKKTYYHKAEHEGDQYLVSGLHDVYYSSAPERDVIIQGEHKVIGLGFTREGGFWVGRSNRGVTRYDQEGAVIDTLLNDLSVCYLYQDHENGIWIATQLDGVYYLGNEHIQYFVPPESNFATSLTATEQGDLMMGFFDGPFYRYQNGRFISDQRTEAYSMGMVQAYRHGKVVESNHDSIIKCYYSEGRSDFSSVSKLSESSEYCPLLIERGSFLEACDYPRKFKLAGNFRLNDACHTAGGFYLASETGLYFLNRHSQTERRLRHSLLGGRIKDIDYWKQNLYLAASGERGLVVFKKTEAQAIGAAEGLTSNVVNEVYVESQSVVWACTKEGLNRLVFDGTDLKYIQTMTTREGLAFEDIKDVEVLRDTVWMATAEGVSYFPLSAMTMDRSFDPCYFRLNEVRVNGRTDAALNNLDYYQNYIQIDLHTISFRHATQVSYRYRLEADEEEGWTYTDDAKVTFQDLPPGDYKVMVQAGVRGEWKGQPEELSFTIMPPWYQSGWSIALLCALALIFFLGYRLSRRRKALVTQTAHKELINELATKLKPRPKYLVVRENGADLKISSEDILYIKSAGNYLEVHTGGGKHVIREKISNFLSLVPDPEHYARVHRSYIVRIDKVKQKSGSALRVKEVEIKVGQTYRSELDRIRF